MVKSYVLTFGGYPRRHHQSQLHITEAVSKHRQMMDGAIRAEPSALRRLALEDWAYLDYPEARQVFIAYFDYDYIGYPMREELALMDQDVLKLSTDQLYHLSAYIRRSADDVGWGE